MIRAFVEGITLDATSGSAELIMKKLPEPDLLGTGSSFQVVAGVRYEAQRRTRREVVRVRFEARGRVLVPVGALPVDDWAPASSRSTGVNGA